MAKSADVSPEFVRHVRRQLNETQVRFARRLGVDPVTVARWETGQRRCAGPYAKVVRGLAPPTAEHPLHEDATISALAQLARTLFHGSTATALCALLEYEALSEDDLDALTRLIEAKRKARKTTRKETR
jgi:transcriptional regulator with XRE-family HTH domain